MRVPRKPDAETYFPDVLRILSVNDGWVTTDYIAQLLDINIADTREVLAQMRNEGYPIIGKKHTGIRLAKTHEELGNYIDRLEAEIETRMTALDTLNRLIKRGEMVWGK